MQLSRQLQRTQLNAKSRGRLVSVRAAEPFNEGASQVKRLINRDRKEFLVGSGDLLDKFTTEFGDGTSSSGTSSSVTTSTLPSDNPFGSSPVSPFSQGAAAAQPFRKSSIEPAGLRPDMGPDPVQKEKAFNLLESITLTQILIVLSFTLIIGLMVSTFFFVYNVGGVRLNGI